MPQSVWWYGIALFPLVLLLNVLGGFGSRTFLATLVDSGDPNAGVALASFLLSVAAFWGSVLVAVIVLVCLLADIRALGRDDTWSPSPLWGVAGLAHLVGAVFSVSLVLSIPALSYYLYRRHERLGTP